MLVDGFLPEYDVAEIHQVEVHASPEVTWGAIRETDLRDGLIDALFRLRELPLRILRRLQGVPDPRPGGPVTFESIVNDGPGFTLLGEREGREFVVGSVGRFWRKDYGGRPVTAEEFATFDEPGYARLAMSFRVAPSPTGGTILRYEARTATTDDDARRTFRRYWRIIRPGVALVMRRALGRIKQEAERRAG